MPECLSCSRYDAKEQVCTVVGGSPIRKCVIAILDEECPTYKGRVLEIGCGGWDYAKRLCEEAGCEWHGVDPMIVDTKGRPSIATRQGTVTDIPYPNEHFDVALGVQSFEHWLEFKSAYDDGLREIFRVMKPGGLLSLNFPIHFHGHAMFVNGNFDVIRGLFPESDWEVKIEPWRKEHGPLPAFKGWRTCGVDDEAVVTHGGSSSWIAQLHATKKVTASGDGALSREDTEALLSQTKSKRAPYLYHERLVPNTPRWKSRWPEHLARYEWVVREAEAKFGDLHGCKILEVGCGVGAGAKLLAELGAHVTAVDYADQALQVARDEFPHPNVRLVQDDGERLVTIDGCFDIVIAFDVLERVHHPEKLLKRCNELLRPHGLLFCSTPNTEQFPKRDDGTTPQNPFHIREYNSAAFRDMLKGVFPYATTLDQAFTASFQAALAEHEAVVAHEKVFAQRVLRKIRRTVGMKITPTPLAPLPEIGDVEIGLGKANPRHFVAICKKEV